MSDPHHSSSEHDDAAHEGPVKTVKQLIAAVIFAFVIPIAVIVLLVSHVGSSPKPAAGSDGMSPEATAKRIQPVATVEVKDLNDPASMKTGDQVFAAQCSACHTAGVAGAPKFGDTAAWAPRVGQGYETLLTHALKGKGAMGPQGGGDFSDFEIGRAVVYMANKGGAKFDEPKMPAAGAADAAYAAAPPAATVAAASTPATAAPAVAPAPAPATTPAPAKAADAGAPPALYAQSCQVCHAQGLAGAPKLGDKAAWAPRIAQGIDTLTAHVISGKGAMPPRGGSAGSDADIKATVTYMVGAAK
jgi:cytochrome c5